MRWSLVLAFCLGVCVLPALAQEPLTQADIRAMQEEISRADRELRDYDRLLVDLESSAKQTNKNNRSKAIGRLENVQKDVILRLEARLGEDYTIRRHGQEAEEVTTKQAEEGNLNSPARQKNTTAHELGGKGVQSAGYRLVRMQEIFVILQRNRQQAIERDAQALDRYYRLSREFGALMLYDRDDLFGQLPAEAQEEYLKTMVK